MKRKYGGMYPVITFCENFNHGKSGYLMEQKCGFNGWNYPTRKNIYDRINKTRRSLSILHSFKENNIEFNESGLLVINMMWYPQSVKDHQFKQAEKLLDHYKRNHVRVNRLT